MRRTGIVVAALAVVVALGAGYWWGSRSRPDSAPVMAKPAVVPERRIAYYRNPMGLPDTSPVPKKDSMGMEYIPVYEGDELEGKQLQLSTEKIQKLGVKTETATLRDLARPIRAVGTLEVDERGLHTVTARFEGYVQRLYVNATGQSVGRGQPVAAVYSPDLVAAQREYLVARQGVAALKDADADARSRMRDLEGASLARLRYWQISDDQIEQLKRDGRVRETLTLHSPAAGVVLERMVVEGMRFMPGEPLLKIADLSTMWLLADVFEQDLALVRVGETATFRVNAFPDRAFRGRVSFIYPSLNPQTRTAKVRIELPNRDGALKPSMYSTVEISIPAGAGKVLTVPT
ncbi:MAG: efflux RND transporter periplasmic adaptor subunit, partial [Burkholderiales bacterium]